MGACISFLPGNPSQHHNRDIYTVHPTVRPWQTSLTSGMDKEISIHCFLPYLHSDSNAPGCWCFVRWYEAWSMVAGKIKLKINVLIHECYYYWCVWPWVWLLMRGEGFYSKPYVTDCRASVPREAPCKGCLSLELPGVPRQPGTFDQD